ncbi:HIT domain-containing protein [Candidatus Nomurabacteria bacterium]|nr:HIT domain-containing protein [Candidatus Nomurabacteria bacterium]
MNYDDFLKIPRECPFCVRKNNEVIEEDDLSYITYALAPYHEDHLLVIPKRHIEKILDVKDNEEDSIYKHIRKATKILHKLGYKDISILVRDGDDSMKSISHLHYNIIPDTRLGDIDHQGKKRVVLSEKEVEALYKRLKNAS